MRTALALLVAVAAPAWALTYPGPAPCNGTLQACVDGSAPGDTVAIATNSAIDQDVTIAKSLTLAAAPGFTPTIGTGPTHRVVTLGDAAPGGGSVDVGLTDLALSNAEIKVALNDDGGHRVDITRCTVSHGTMGTLATGIDVAVGVPATVTLDHVTVAAPGTAIRLTTTLASGEATLTVVGSRVTTFTPTASVVGIGVDVRGAGAVTTYVYSNVVYGVGGAGTGTRAGISVRTADSTGSAAVNVVNNTVDDIRGATTGIQILSPPPTGATIAVNLFNNIVTRATRSGIAVLQSPEAPTLTVTSGFDDTFGNTLADAYGGYTPGPNMLSVDPLYVNAASGDYHLQPGSPVVDAGSAAPVGGLPPVDADGNARVAGAAPDLGAYELGSAPVTSTTTTSSTTTTLPAGPCPVVATYDSIGCRLGEVADEVRAGVPAGRVADDLLAAVGRATKAVQDAEAKSAAGKRRGSRAALSRALRALGRFVGRLDSRGARNVPASVRAALTLKVDRLRTDVRALRAG